VSKSLRQSADVVIVGGGIQGLSAAYHLARASAGRIVLVEAELIGSGSSGRSASMLMLQRENAEKIALSKFSYSRYAQFEDETGYPTRFRKIGFLSVVPSQIAGLALERAALRQKMGVNTQVLGPEEIASLVPVVNVSDIAVGIYGPDDGVIDAASLLAGYAAGARRLGVDIRENVTATNVVVESDRVVAVETTEGVIATRCVINAAGANARTVAGWVGTDLPILNRRRSIFVTKDEDLIPADSPMVEDAEAEWYYRKEGRGVLMGMGKEDSSDVSMDINWSFAPTVFEFAAHRVPALSTALLSGGWSGIRPLTPDLNPILGPVDSAEGFINSCGWGGEGIMHAPAGGQIVADIVMRANHPSFEIRPFLASRFSRRSTDQLRT
jgi:sarcosine oxidase subunit beta